MKGHLTLIFDLDGTLIDATRVIIGGFNHVLTRQGLPAWERERVLALMGRPLAEMFSPIAGEHGLDCADLVEEYVAYSRANAATQIVLLPGADRLLQTCRSAGCRMGVYTSRTTSSANRMLRILEVDHLFSEIVGVDQVTYPKPHPEGIELVLSRFSASVSDGVMLGDTPDDVQAARSAGVRAMAVATGYFSSRDLLAAGAERVFNNLESFEDYLSENSIRSKKGEKKSS